MLTATPTRIRTPAGRRCAATVFLCAALLPGPLRADEGLTVQLPAVLTEDLAQRLDDVLDVPLRRYEAARQHDPKQQPGGFTLLCDFNPPPDNRPDATGSYGPCRDLARKLRELQLRRGVRTVAYVHGEVSRHAVLPVLACGEILMSSEPPARLGKIVDPGGALDDDEKTAYETMGGARFPPALVRKMYDRDLVVVQLPNPDKDGNRFIDARQAARERLNGNAVDRLGAGEIAFYDFDQAAAYGLCQQDAHNTLADALAYCKLSPSPARVYALSDHAAASRVIVRGEVNGLLREDVERRLDRALGDRADVIVLQLECAGGDDRVAYELADFIAALRGRADKPIKTVAYVTPQARDTALFLALACDRIYMQKDAHLGDFDRYLKDNPGRLEAIRTNLRAAAEKGLTPPALAEGMVVADPRTGKFPRLDAEEAKRAGLAAGVVNDYEELCTLEKVKPEEVGADWLNALAEFLCHPLTSVILVMIGVTCLIVELKMPGASLPGVIAAVCFVLFFWSESQLHGQITWLAVLLFILGLLLIGVEVFVLPGTGVCGISGAVLTVGGLVLVAFGHWPQTGEDWIGFGQKLGPFGLGILGSVLAAFVVVRYLNYIPFLNRLILKPRTEADEDGETSSPEPITPELASLLGAIGVAATPLRPAGKTRFGDEFVDVVAEGGYVRPGARVQVIEIEGNRVVVKEV